MALQGNSVHIVRSYIVISPITPKKLVFLLFIWLHVFPVIIQEFVSLVLPTIYHNLLRLHLFPNLLKLVLCTPGIHWSFFETSDVTMGMIMQLNGDESDVWFKKQQVTKVESYFCWYFGWWLREIARISSKFLFIELIGIDGLWKLSVSGFVSPQINLCQNIQITDYLGAAG